MMERFSLDHHHAIFAKTIHDPIHALDAVIPTDHRGGRTVDIGVVGAALDFTIYLHQTGQVTEGRRISSPSHPAVLHEHLHQAIEPFDPHELLRALLVQEAAKNDPIALTLPGRHAQYLNRHQPEDDRHQGVSYSVTPIEIHPDVRQPLIERLHEIVFLS